MSGSALGIFIVYLGKTLYELSKSRGYRGDRLPCSESISKLLMRQTTILETMSTSLAILLDRNNRRRHTD